MCFSATASFTASAVLIGTGIVAIKKMESPRMLAFASGPILFGLQQFFEGVLWLTFSNPDLLSWQAPTIYLFTIFAQIIWPLWAPFAIWSMEPHPLRKKVISHFLWIGVVRSAFIIYWLFAYDLSATIDSNHIIYSIEFPWEWFRRVLYFLATVVPFFLSSLRWMKLFGAALVVSLILTWGFYTLYVASVWCFFGALLSVLVLLVIKKNRVEGV